MKNTMIAGAFALIGILFFSCSKEQNITSTATETRIIKATASIVDQNTKTDYTDAGGAGNGLAVNWSAVDSFKAFYAGNNAVTFSKTEGNEFTAEVPGNASSFWAVDGPVSYDGSTYIIGLGSQIGGGETESVGNLAKYDAMIATVQNDVNHLHFSFAHQCAFLRIKLQRGNSAYSGATEDQQKTVCLILKNCKINASQINGSDVEYKGWKYDPTKLTFKIDIKLSSALALNADKEYLYVAIPPLTYASGTAGNIMPDEPYCYNKTFTFTDGFSFVAGNIYDTTISFGPAPVTATFGTPASSATYGKYSWTATTNNLMTLFTFGNGELAHYSELKFTISNLTGGNVRLYYYGPNKEVVYTTNGTYTVDLNSFASENSFNLSDVTSICFGGKTNTGDVTILAGNAILSDIKKPDSFVSLSGSQNATYTGNTYTWTSNSNNLMTLLEFPGGELSQYKSLSVTTSNMSNGANWRMGYVLEGGTFTQFTGSPYYSAETKTVDLVALAASGVDLSKVTKIQMGGNSTSGNIDIEPANVVLSGDSITASYGDTAGNGTSASTYSWTASTNNLMTVFTFANGELANYSKLKFNLSDMTGDVRVRFDGDSEGMAIKYFGSNGDKTINLTGGGDSGIGIDLSKVKKIVFGGNSSSGSVVIKPSEMYLTNE